jgi:hypothetical protein
MTDTMTSQNITFSSLDTCILIHALRGIRYVILMREQSKMLTRPRTLLKGKVVSTLHHKVMKECMEVEV